MSSATNVKPVKSQSASSEISYETVTYKAWNPTAHSVGQVKPNKGGMGDYATLTYPQIGSKRFLLVTPPKMIAPFGANPPYVSKDKKGEENSSKAFSLNLSFSNNQADSEEMIFLEKVKQLDDHMIETVGELAIKDPAVWYVDSKKFKTPESIRTVISSKYKSMLRTNDSPDKNFPPLISCKFQTNFKSPELFATSFFNSEKKPLSVSQDPNADDYICRVITPHSRVTALISGTIWSNSNTGFGISWKVVQLVIYPSVSIPLDVCLIPGIEDPEDEEDDVTGDDDYHPAAVHQQSIPSLKPSPVQAPVQPRHVTSDPIDEDQQDDGDVVEDEEELVDEVEPEAVPVPVPAPVVVVPVPVQVKAGLRPKPPVTRPQ